MLEVGLVGGAGGAFDAMAVERECYEIMVQNGTRLRVPVGFRDESVRRLLKLLGEVS